jgi:hypothetical protein
MKKLIAIALTVALISSGLVVSVASADDGGSNALGGVSVATTYEYTDTGWAETYTESQDCIANNGWAKDDWELTVSAFGFLTVNARDSFIVGDYFEIWIDGVKEYTTTNPGCKTSNPYSEGSVTVWLDPGIHTIEIRDALDFVTCTGMCPAGYYITGVWEPVVEFTKEITGEVEAGDMDGRLEPGEDWQWTMTATLTNISGETIEVEKFHDRLGGDLEWHLVVWIAKMGTLDIYTKGKTEKVFLNWYDGFTLADGESVWVAITVSPDVNTGTGNGKKPGHQEYTSTGIHELNSGAWFGGYIGDEYIEGSTNPVSVEVLEAD